MPTLASEDGTEREIDCNQPIRGQITSRDGKLPSVFLRYSATNQNRGHIRVYPGGLRFVTRCNLANAVILPKNERGTFKPPTTYCVQIIVSKDVLCDKKSTCVYKVTVVCRGVTMGDLKCHTHFTTLSKLHVTLIILLSRRETT